ncbi:hypothetical protein RJ641_030807 [Dillenia turbinata]|uniref:Uncharacterized protein n=1 Tax=Dillenia turbinata TaxID=194707 RepID=A0AAN8VNY1_9MAGN
MATSPSLTNAEKKHWWLTNKKIVDKYVKDARSLIATHEQSDIASALNLLDAALSLSPKLEIALELKAKCLLHLRRFKEVADMLQDYIPSVKMGSDETASSSSSSSSDSSSQPLTRERVKLLSESGTENPSFKCFSVSDLKKKVMAGLYKNCEKEGQWRYLVLGQACCHLGLMEDAMALLQTGKRLATDAFRRESNCWSDDSFAISCSETANASSTPPRTESENITHLLNQIKVLLRRRTSAIAALDAGLYSEAIRHFSKLVDSRRGSPPPQSFVAECYMYRASAYKASGRIADSIADCNRTLALDPSCIEALSTRASLLESIRCIPDCLHDLEHLRLLYNSILRDRKLPGPAWKRQSVRYREIPGKLCALSTKIQELKQRVAMGETGNVDYFALIGLRRGCSRSELERAHLLLCLKHKPDKATNFVDKCEIIDDCDLDSVKDRAKMSALLLYRLLQKGYSSVMNAIMDEEAAEKQRKKEQQATETTKTTSFCTETTTTTNKTTPSPDNRPAAAAPASSMSSNASVFQGVFCRDIAAVSNLLSQVGFSRPIPVKYEALSC